MLCCYCWTVDIVPEDRDKGEYDTEDEDKSDQIFNKTEGNHRCKAHASTEMQTQLIIEVFVQILGSDEHD